MSQSHSDMLKVWKKIRIDAAQQMELRDEIRASWERSVSYGVSPYLKVNPTVLSKKELEAKLEENQELLDTAVPIVESMIEFVMDSSFVIALGDKQGTLLVVLGAGEGIEFAQRANLVEGSLWAEDIMGTNAVGLCLSEGKPIQVYGYEHYCICAYNSTCCAAPIRDPFGNIIGVLNITAPFEKVHYHTLGMVVAGIIAIENQIALKRTLREKVLTDQYKTSIMESISEGLITTDSYGYITHLNRRAADLLQLDSTTAISQHLAAVLDNVEANNTFLNLVRSKKTVTDAPVNITQHQQKIKCNITCRPLLDQDGTDLGRVVVLQEFKRVNRLVSQLVGPQAKIDFAELMGTDSSFLSSLRLAQAAAASDCNVLLLGESGTGKDVFAQAIHNSSVRSGQPFVAINCGAIPRELIASELFGYDEGAFTGARKGGNPGKFELADQGTIFFDEIGEMPVDLQAVLLRVLEERRIMRVGGREYLPANAKVIAATNRDLALEVERGNFRRDLFYRLSVMVISLPPLRERRNDIELLAVNFLQRICKRLDKDVRVFSPDVMEVFLNYSWPGNIRELQNVLERAVNLAPGEVITFDLLPSNLANLPTPSQEKILPLKQSPNSIKSLEEQLIRNCLAKFRSRTDVARQLGLSRSTLYRKMKEYGIKPSS